MSPLRLPQEAEIASLPFVDRVCPHREVAGIVQQLPRDMDLLVHCKVRARCVSPPELGTNCSFLEGVVVERV